MINQAMFSCFHAGVMVGIGVGLGRLNQLSPKLSLAIGVVSSVVFQIFSKFLEKQFETESELEDKTEEQKQWFRRGNCLAASLMGGFASSVLVALTFNDPSSVTQGVKEFAKVAFLSLTLSFTCFLAAKTGNYLLLEDRDFQLYGYDSDVAWEK